MSGEVLDQFLGQQQTPTASLGKLEDRLGQVWEIAREFGLDPFPTHFEIIPPEMMHEIGSIGLPERFSHWTHGQGYRQLKTRYDYGMGTIYEVVINGNPSRAFLLENNSEIENTVVMGHVLGHTDFFKNNYQFQQTRRDMPHAAAVNAARISGYEFEHGQLVVEQFLDAALSVAEHIDPFQINRLPKTDQIAEWKEDYNQNLKSKQIWGEFDDLFDRLTSTTDVVTVKPPFIIPFHPEKDLLGFIADFSPSLEEWQRDILHIVRMESLYFHPQRRTKIMNEGWASYWHKRIMREMSNRGTLTQEEQLKWVVMHSGVITPNPKSLNPYHFGMGMFDFIEDYYNGQLEDAERRWLDREQLPVYPRYNGPYIGSPGHRMVREVMMREDDQSFVRNHFNKIPADRMEMFVYDEKQYGDLKVTVIADRGWERIRDLLTKSMNNSGDPYLTVNNADYDMRQSLYIKHAYEGQELDINYLKRTLPYLYALWGRNVHIETVVDSKPTLFGYDGTAVEIGSP